MKRERGTVEECLKTELVRELRRSRRLAEDREACQTTTVAAVTGIERKQTL